MPGRVEGGFNTPAILSRVQAASGAGAHSAARAVLRRSQPRCPYDHGPQGGQPAGHMRDSGRVTKLDDGRWAVSYERPGRDGAAITVRQHEDMTLRHPDGMAKWLEFTVREYVSQALIEMGEVTRREFGR